MRARRGWSYVGVLALTVSAIACRQLVGIGTEPPGGDAGTDAASEAAAVCGGFAWTAGSCTACMQASCCDEATTCRGDASCASTFDCVAKCGARDELCRTRCVTQGDDAMAKLGSCQSKSCASQCGLECGGWGLAVGLFAERVEASKACAQCLPASKPLCGQLASCVSDEACLAFIFCTQDCIPFDQVCTGNCGYTNPLPSAETLANSFLSSCTSACQFGSDWSCLGGLHWPSATTSEITHRFQVFDLGTSTPLAGVTAKACSGADADCSSPLTKPPFPESDSKGAVSLIIPVRPGTSFDGYIEVRKSGYVTELQFTFPSLAESNDPPPATLSPMLPMLTTEVAQAFAEAADATYDPSLGTIFAQPDDCEGLDAPGVSFTGSDLGPTAKPYYLFGNLPTAPTAEVMSTVTQSGTTPGGGFFDVAPGLVTLVASDSKGKQVSSVRLQVRAGALTFATLVPTGAP